MDKGKCDKLMDSIAYIIWSLSLWMLSYYQLLECEFSAMGRRYGKALWFWIVSAIILYGNSKSELKHELFKSCSILVGSSILEMVYNSEGTIYNLNNRLIVFFCYQILGFIIIAFLSYSKKLHGRYTKRLALLYMTVLGITYFIFRWNIPISLISASIISWIIGYRYYLINLLERKQEEKLIEEERKKEEDLRKSNKKCQEELLDLKLKNKKLQDKISLYENKKKRNKRRSKKL